MDELIKFLIPHIKRLLTISGAALGIVYVLGRMLMFNISDRTKNLIAIICMFTFSFIITEVYFSEGKEILEKIWESTAYALIGCVVYVLVMWRLYWRIDNLLDKKVGKDKEITFTKTTKPRSKVRSRVALKKGIKK